MIKAVLFDLDNTLADTRSRKIKCVKQSIKKMIAAGLDMGYEKAFSLIMKIYKKSDYENSTIFQDFLIESTGKIDYKILSAAIVEYRKIRYKYEKPYNGMKETLRAMRKYDNIILGILTDTSKIRAWTRLTSLGLADFFDIVLTFDDTKSKKPGINGFKKAIKILKLNPEEILYIGDIPEKDIKGAKNAGMKTALAKYGQFLPDSTAPDYVVNNPRELIKILKSENNKS